MHFPLLCVQTQLWLTSDGYLATSTCPEASAGVRGWHSVSTFVPANSVQDDFNKSPKCILSHLLYK